MSDKKHQLTLIEKCPGQKNMTGRSRQKNMIGRCWQKKTSLDDVNQIKLDQHQSKSSLDRR